MSPKLQGILYLEIFELQSENSSKENLCLNVSIFKIFIVFAERRMRGLL